MQCYERGLLKESCIVPMTNMTMVNFVYLCFLLIWIRCTTGDTLFSCNFGITGDETFCGMVQDEDDQFDWKLTAASEKANTGPGKDHTGNANGTGRFLWANSEDGAPGAMATISTPPFNMTNGEGWLTFWYHIYGDGKLEISVCTKENSVRELNGQPTNMEWLELNLAVSCEDEPVQITLTSTINSRIGDVGIDDLHLYDNIMTSTDKTDTSVTTPISPSSMKLTTSEPFTSLISDGDTTVMTMTTDASEPPTSISPQPLTGLALPITLGIVAVFFVVALIILTCFIMKRRTQEKPISQGTVHRFDNHAYSTELDDVRGNTTDTRRNTNSTFDSSTWRSEVPTTGGTGTNGTLGGSQSPNRESQASSGGSGSVAPGDTGDSDTRHYFVLNPERASMLIEDTGGGDDAQNRYDPVALYDNKPERYTYIENDGSSNTMATGAAVEAGTDANGYDPVTIKDDITGGYQVVEDTGSTSVGGGMQNPYEPIIVGENHSKSIKTTASERKAPTPATRKNVPPKPKERSMVDNVLYKPMNGEQMVDNVLYNPIHDDK